MDLFDAIYTRRTTRKFTNEQISEEDLNTILSAVQMAPIAGANYLSTHITVVRNAQLLAELREVCARDASTPGPRDAFYNGQTILFFSSAGVSKDNIEYANVACAIENALLAATALGLGSAYIWGCLRKLRKNPETLAKLEIPEGYEVLSAVSLGYAEEPLERREGHSKVGVNIIG